MSRSHLNYILLMLLSLVLTACRDEGSSATNPAGSTSVAKALSSQALTAKYANIDYDVVYVRCPRGRETDSVKWQDGSTSLNWNGVNDLWLESTNNVYHQPGCDLVLHHSSANYSGNQAQGNPLPQGDPGREEVLVNCDEADLSKPVCSVVDPNVSFDGRYVVYSKFMDTRTFAGDPGIRIAGSLLGNTHISGHMKLFPTGGPNGYYAENTSWGSAPYAAPTLIFKYDLVTGKETQVSPSPQFLAGRAHPTKTTEWQSNYPVMDTGPFFMPDGRIGFTSNRDNGFLRFQLFAMDIDGSSMELIGHRSMHQQLHPSSLMDGRVMYANGNQMLQRDGNNQFALFTINPDGSNPFILAGKHDATFYSYNFATQLSDGDIVTTVYYNRNNFGMGSLLRFPVDPQGPDFTHLWGSIDNTKPLDITQWFMSNTFIPFARVGQLLLTPRATPGDMQAIPYPSSADTWTHPSRRPGGRSATIGGQAVTLDDNIITMTGKFSHPSAAPGNGLLATYTIGGSSTMHLSITNLADTLRIVGKDAGVWFMPLEANSTRRIGNIVSDGQIVVDFPEYHEMMPRAVVPYGKIYPGLDHPVIKHVTANLGTKNHLSEAGAPYGLSGAATLIDRETRAINGTPWNVQGTGMDGRSYSNMATSGADLAIYANSEVYGVRVSLPIPSFPNDNLSDANHGEAWAGNQLHNVRILGEFPVRKADGTPVDGQGNPDTSFLVKIPANTPFLFQTLDKRGMALDIETASRSVVAGEQQFCGGCHVHTRESLNPLQSRAVLDSSLAIGDFTGQSAPLFDAIDGSGKPTVRRASDIYPSLPGIASRRSFGVDWRNGISNIIQTRCATCHGENAPAQLSTGLRLDGDDRTYNLLIKNAYIREDGVRIDSSTKPGDGLNVSQLNDSSGTYDRITPRYACCTASRWVSLNSARSSMLVWALYGVRMDGRDPSTGLPPTNSGVLVDNVAKEKPELWPNVGGHLNYLNGTSTMPGTTNMPESEKRLIARWLDIGAPRVNIHDDMIRPVLTVSPVISGNTISSVRLGVWDDSRVDFGKLKVLHNGQDITPVINGTPDVIVVPLGVNIDATNADSHSFTFEIWDKPDRSLSLVMPATVAANRTRVRYTGRALLRMGAVAANSAPSSVSASFTTKQDSPSSGILPAVTDPDVGDSHLFTIASQPGHGSAQIVNNRLVYTPAASYTGSDSFGITATDMGGLSITGVVSVTVEAQSNNAGVVGPVDPNKTATPTSNASSGGGGGIGIVDVLFLMALFALPKFTRFRRLG